MPPGPCPCPWADKGDRLYNKTPDALARKGQQDAVIPNKIGLCHKPYFLYSN